MSLKIVWSYSIYGSDKFRYYQPMLENITIAKELGITVLIFTIKDNLVEITDYFDNYIDDIIIKVIDTDFLVKFPKFMRFIASEVIQSDYYFFKDSDSVVTKKEIEIMNDFITSSKYDYMIIRDHPHHVSPILAGMFGMKAKQAIKFNLRLNQCRNSIINSVQSSYSYDQEWLQKYIYPEILNETMVYTDFFYFKNEKVTKISRSIEDYNYIGAQIWKKKLRITDSNLLFWTYKNKILCMPGIYWYRLVNGRVRLIIIIAYLYTMILKIVK